MSPWIYILVMAFVTYLIRAIPLVLLNRQIHSRFLRSVLYYIPYACLSAMTVPAVFFATRSVISAACGVGAACLLGLKGKNLPIVAAAACLAVFAAELVISFF